MAWTQRVREAARGSGLRTFLRLYEDLGPGLQLFNAVRKLKLFKGWSPSEFSTLYGLYRDIAAGGTHFDNLTASERHTLNSIRINSHLPYVDLVQDRVTYFLRVQGRAAGEGSIYERVIQISSPVTLTKGEIVNRIGEEFGHLVYTQSGALASATGRGVEILNVSFIGVSRLW